MKKFFVLFLAAAFATAGGVEANATASVAGATAMSARLKSELAEAKAELAAAKAQAEAAKAELAAAKADTEVRKAEVVGTVDIVRVQVGTTTIIQPPPPSNSANPNNQVLLPTVHSDRCKGRIVSATAGAMYTYYECNPAAAVPEVSVTRAATSADKDKGQRTTLGECALYGLVGLAGAGVAQLGPVIGNGMGRDMSGSDYGLAAGIGAGTGYLLAFGICALAR